MPALRLILAVCQENLKIKRQAPSPEEIVVTDDVHPAPAVGARSPSSNTCPLTPKKTKHDRDDLNKIAVLPTATSAALHGRD